MRSLIVLLLTLPLLTGCFTHDLVKDVEGKAYDSLANAFSKYCEPQGGGGIISPIVEQEALEARREIRQRGSNGPEAFTVEGVDDQTALGDGPVVRVYCTDDDVPEAVQLDFIRVRPE